MKNPILSVVMSVYNGENYLKEAIDSILKQSFEDFEFIIINDASTDRSIEILEDYAQNDDRIILINKPLNIGLKGFVENLNIGLQKSKGKYVARMDQDDRAELDRFEKQIAYLEKNPETFLIGSSLKIMNELSEYQETKTAITNFVDLERRFKIDNPIFHPAIMFRNDQNLHYRDKFYACEDFDFHLRLISTGRKIENLKEALLNYRVISSSMSRKGNSFIKRLFLEKAKEFHRQRAKLGYDLYDEFKDDELLNILDENAPSSYENLVFASNVAILYNKRDELQLLSKKLKNFYGKSFLIYQLNQIPFVNKIYSKFIKFTY